jgi:hypothetical protein
MGWREAWLLKIRNRPALIIGNIKRHTINGIRNAIASAVRPLIVPIKLGTEKQFWPNATRLSIAPNGMPAIWRIVSMSWP